MPFDSTGLQPWQIQLLNAANIIRTRGLRQGDLGVDGGPRCAYGAIAEAAGIYIGMRRGNPVTALAYCPAAKAVARHLATLPRYAGLSARERIWIFNDDDDTTASDVALLFEHVAFNQR